ncbi:carbohydrate ABC transporter permease [Neobacillus massiliamazoniensis]|uniref:Sugar ABC transporter permease n=1 Tax=Neobacillus massiliamazoniensis TaxID=1499688 RepID=A0A0U1P493_9BACI|nr:sugar ABC transporter permease [Neobacillus massiliamazoniensis]CRK85060.1 sugar ABC transporter permease [Neobacillus massiliamazoniensis]
MAQPSIVDRRKPLVEKGNKPPLKLKTKQTLVAYSFLAIPLLFFLCIRIFPTLYSFSMSFSMQNGGGFTLRNYQHLMKDQAFWKSVWNTCKYVVITVPLQMGLSLIVALAIERVRHWRWFYRMIYFIPYITSVVAISWVWRLMYDPSVGFLNVFINWFGIHPQNWLRDPKESLFCVSIVMIWQSMGFSMLIFMAGLQGVPKHLYEAAQIDGAGRWKTFWKITFPLLNPTIVFLTVTGVIQALQTFTQIQNLTAGSGASAGGPLNSTLSIVVYMYQSAFQEFNMEYASAIAVVLFIFILLVTLLQMKVLNKSYEY